MNYFNRFIALVCLLACVSACKYDDSDLWNALNKQEMRLSALEKWRSSVEEELKSIQGIITATDYVTGLEQIEKNGKSGYKISFLHASPITLFFNANHEVSGTGVISVTQDGDKYYWTLDGKPLLVNGEKVYVTNDSPASLTPNKDNPEIFDLTIGDYTVTVDQHAVGTHPIKSITSDSGKVIVTLNDNSTKELPLWVNFENLVNSKYPHMPGDAEFPIPLPQGFIMRPLGVGTQSEWKISVSGQGPETVLKVHYPTSGAITTSFAISDGRALTVIREIAFEVNGNEITWTTIHFDGQTPITIPQGVENVKIVGTTSAPIVLNTKICTPLKNSTSVKRIDLSEVVHSGAIPANAFFNNLFPNDLNNEANKNETIEEIILPKKFAAIWANAFRNCKALKTVIILNVSRPARVDKDVFTGCTALEHIYVPENLVETYQAFPNLAEVKDKIVPLTSKEK